MFFVVYTRENPLCGSAGLTEESFQIIVVGVVERYVNLTAGRVMTDAVVKYETVFLTLRYAVGSGQRVEDRVGIAAVTGLPSPDSSIR